MCSQGHNNIDQKSCEHKNEKKDLLWLWWLCRNSENSVLITNSQNIVFWEFVGTISSVEHSFSENSSQWGLWVCYSDWNIASRKRFCCWFFLKCLFYCCYHIWSLDLHSLLLICVTVPCFGAYSFEWQVSQFTCQSQQWQLPLARPSFSSITPFCQNVDCLAPVADKHGSESKLQNVC